MVIKFTTSIGDAYLEVPAQRVQETLAMLHTMPGVLQEHPDHPIEVLLDLPVRLV